MNKKITIGITVVVFAIFGTILISRGDSVVKTSQPKAVQSITHGHGLAVDIADSNKVYVATHHGLLILQNDKDLHQVGGVKDDYMGFSIHPTVANVFFSSGHPASGGNIGFQKSEDSGITWSKISNGVNGPVDFHAMTVSSVNPNLIYGWYNGSLQQTTDGGKSWVILKTNLTNVIALAADTSDENVAYAATTKGAYVTKDKGITWSGLSADIRNGAVAAIAVNPSDSSRLLSFSEQLGLAMSEDKGVTWKSIKADFADEAILFITYDRKQPNIVYSLTHKNSLYRSVDGGKVWNKINI